MYCQMGHTFIINEKYFDILLLLCVIEYNFQLECRLGPTLGVSVRF